MKRDPTSFSLKMSSGPKEVFEWLVENIGPLLHDEILEATGEGWHAGVKIFLKGGETDVYWVVTLDDPAEAVRVGLLFGDIVRVRAKE